MQAEHWFLLIGGLMLARGLWASTIMRLPLTAAIVYLAVGLILGPTFLNIFHFNPLKQSAILEVMTEIAVLISLFSAGVKMPVPIDIKRWNPPIRLAWLSMTVTVGLVAAFSYFVLGLPIGAGVLLGAILAPTDPVLATDVQVRHAGDKDKLRFLLTCEAGMNDGSAFPFVMLGLGLLGLHDIGQFGLAWFAVDVLWATIAAVLIGIICGVAVAKAGWKLRSGKEKHEVLDDLVGLGLIATAYGVCLWVGAWGFLAIFFAGVALRHTELILAGAPKDRQGYLEDDINKSAAAAADPDHTPPLTVSSEALVFKEHLERLSELTLVLLIGGMVYLGEWSWRAAGTALFLFVIARPISVYVGLLGSGISLKVRAISAWFGVRGIGSVYYLMYAIQHGLPEPIAVELTQITLTVVMLSIFIHGATVKPVMDRFWVSR